MILFLRRELFAKVHYFIHLNLSITLCLAYITFVAGIEKGATYQVSNIQHNDMLHEWGLTQLSGYLTLGLIHYQCTMVDCQTSCLCIHFSTCRHLALWWLRCCITSFCQCSAGCCVRVSCSTSCWCLYSAKFQGSGGSF